MGDGPKEQRDNGRKMTIDKRIMRDQVLSGDDNDGAVLK